MFDYHAISVKCKAMAAEMLDNSDFSDLCESGSLSDLYYKLKSSGKLETGGEEIGAENISRERLEDLYWYNLLSAYRRLVSFSSESTREVLLRLSEKNYISIIFDLLRVIESGGGADKARGVVPLILIEEGKINWPALIAAKNSDEFLDSLGRFEEYTDIVRRYPDEAGRIKRLNNLEIEVTNKYYERLILSISKTGPESERSRALKIVAAEIKEINKERLGRLESFSVKETERYLIRTKMPVAKGDDGGKSLSEIARKELRGEPGIAVIIAFLTLKQIEKEKLTKITECVRYSLPPSEIKSRVMTGAPEKDGDNF